MLDPISLQDTLQTGILLAETEPWVQPLYSVLDPFFNLFSFAMVSLFQYPWNRCLLLL